MSEEIKVSVVVPIYNVEKYLRQCLDSIVNQTLHEIEIICVNDGSTDLSASIIGEYAEKDPRIVVISKPNSGYGHSMNCGFDKASGQYIGIIESDDYAEPDMFEKLYASAKKDDLDAVKSGFCFYWSTPEVKNEEYHICSEIMSRRIFCPTRDFRSKQEMVDFFSIKPSIWSAIYKQDFIRKNGIRFNETPGASFQDTSFNFKVWACAEKIRLLPECFLHYRQDNECSSINSPGKVYCICDEYAEIDRFIEQQPLKRSFLAPLSVRLRYDSYFWNYYRLNEELAKEFMQRFHDDFAALNQKGLVQSSYFNVHKWQGVKRIISMKPEQMHQYCQDLQKSASNAPLPENVSKMQMLVRKIRRCYRCYCENGFRYTLRRLLEKAANKLR